jgi:hypothetical protein
LDFVGRGAIIQVSLGRVESLFATATTLLWRITDKQIPTAM